MARIIQNGTDAAAFNDVTRESRITGTARRRDVVMDPVDGFAPSLHWGPVLGSVAVGVAFSTMLMIMGVATGLIAGDKNSSAGDVGGILGAVGAWMVLSVLIGSFVGSFVGGRMTRWMDRLSVAGHTLVSWGIATLLTIALASLVTIGFASSTTSVAATAAAADAQNVPGAAGERANTGATPQTADTNGKTNDTTTANEAANNAGDALGGAGWGLAVGMLLSLVASGLGWFIGARRRLTDIERENTEPIVA